MYKEAVQDCESGINFLLFLTQIMSSCLNNESIIFVFNLINHLKERRVVYHMLTVLVED